MAGTTWEEYYRQRANDLVAERQRLDKAAENVRCPFILTRGGGRLDYGDALRCVRDVHDDVDHELAGGAWAHPDSIEERF